MGLANHSTGITYPVSDSVVSLRAEKNSSFLNYQNHKEEESGYMEYKPYTLKNLLKISQLNYLDENQLINMQVMGRVLPFKTNNYVVDELIDWDDFENDPMFILNFPIKEMLKPDHFNRMADLVKSGAGKDEIQIIANRIRLELNPHPAGQMKDNVPVFNGAKIMGAQHKYRETMLCFPIKGQTCHAYCTFCFRWPQFTGMSGQKFAMKHVDTMVGYINEHPEITDILITGGDPLFMNAASLNRYIDALLETKQKTIRNIRIGTKSLSFWPYRFLTDKDSKDLLDIFRKITDSGIHLSIMAHLNHYAELSTEAFREAVVRINETGATIKSQSPLLNHINASPHIWSEMWKQQTNLGITPYYMFVVRNTGAQNYFAVPLARAYEIYRNAYSKVSGLARTVRGPSMSAFPGKVKVDGIAKINGKKFFILSFIQCRNPDWVKKPFFAEYNESAIWLDELKPAFGEEKFFFE